MKNKIEYAQLVNEGGSGCGVSATENTKIVLFDAGNAEIFRSNLDGVFQLENCVRALMGDSECYCVQDYKGTCHYCLTANVLKKLDSIRSKTK